MCLCTRDCGRGSRWRGGKGSSEKNVCTLNLWDGMNRTMVWRYEWSWQRKRCQLASVQLALSHLYTFHLPWWEPVQLKMKWKWNWGKEIGCRYWKFNHWCPSSFNFVCYCFESNFENSAVVKKTYLESLKGQGWAFFKWTKHQLEAVKLYIPPVISKSQATTLGSKGAGWNAQCVLESPQTVTDCQLECHQLEIVPWRRDRQR